MYDNINSSQYAGLVLLDFKKAFDTVSHSVLVHKLQHYSVRGPSLDLLQSCFDQRKQFVSIVNTSSQIASISFGVPQGSTLGPLLFLIYINDLPNAVNCIPRLFADDTCLISRNFNLSKLESDMNEDLVKIQQWCLANKVTINPVKSSALIIPPKITKPNISAETAFTLKKAKILLNPFVKYFGLLIDHKLNFQKHIALLEKKVSRAVGIISKVKYFLPQVVLRQLYFALIHSQLIYGLIIWGSTYPSYLRKLAALQNRAILLVGGGNRYQRVTPFFVLLDELKLVDLFRLEAAKFMYKFIHNKLPSSFSNYFVKTLNISSRITRTSSNSRPNNLYIPKFSSTRLQTCIKYHGVKTWDSIPTEIQKLSFTKFITEYKSYLISFYK